MFATNGSHADPTEPTKGTPRGELPGEIPTETLSDDELRDRLCLQAAHVAVGECHLVLLIAELDRREAWGGEGILSCAHWLNWRCGISLATAREQLRVGRAIEHLPLVRQAFASGRLSYSKVRAITRMANSRTEKTLVEWATQCSASQLECLVRACRKAHPEEGKRALALHDKRYFRSYTDEDGMVVISARLSPDDGAVVLGAIEAARRAMWANEHRRPQDRPGETSEVEDPSGRDVPGTEDESSAYEWDEHEGSGPDPSEMHDVSAETSVEPRAGDADSSRDVSAETRLGLSEVSGEPDPQDVTTVALSVDEAAFPGEGPYDEAEATRVDALVAVCESVLEKGRLAEGSEPKVKVLVHVDKGVLVDPTQEGCSHIEGVGAISSHTAARLACGGEVCEIELKSDGSLEQVAPTRGVPRRMRQVVAARDGGCRYPGCTRRHFVDAHHVVFWSRGGQTKPSNLVSLCRAHHRLVHEGGYRLQMSPSGAARVWHPSGYEIPSHPPPLRARGPGLEERHRRDGIWLRPDSLEGYEDRFDLRMTSDCLLVLDAREDADEGGEEPEVEIYEG